MKAVFAIFAVLALHIVQGQTLRSEENFDQIGYLRDMVCSPIIRA